MASSAEGHSRAWWAPISTNVGAPSFGPPDALADLDAVDGAAVEARPLERELLDQCGWRCLRARSCRRCSRAACGSRSRPDGSGERATAAAYASLSSAISTPRATRSGMHDVVLEAACRPAPELGGGVQHDLDVVVAGVLGQVQAEQLQGRLVAARGVLTLTSCGWKTLGGRGARRRRRRVRRAVRRRRQRRRGLAARMVRGPRVRRDIVCSRGAVRVAVPVTTREPAGVTPRSARDPVGGVALGWEEPAELPHEETSPCPLPLPRSTPRCSTRRRRRRSPTRPSTSRRRRP